MNGISISNARWHRPNGATFYQPHRLRNVSTGEGGGPPAVLTPEQIKTDGLFGVTGRNGVLRTGTSVTGWQDQTGNGRDVSFAGGKEAFYSAAYIDGLPGIQMLSTTVGTFGTTVLLDNATARGIYMVIKNTAEGGTYYHTFACFTTSVAASNLNIVISNDPSYGFFFNIIPGVAIGMDHTELVTTDSALILNYDGVSATSASSYTAAINDVDKTVTAKAGGNSNSNNNNYINSYGNTGIPDFPATDSYIMELWLFGSVISTAERALFKAFGQYYYPSIIQ